MKKNKFSFFGFKFHCLRTIKSSAKSKHPFWEIRRDDGYNCLKSRSAQLVQVVSTMYAIDPSVDDTQALTLTNDFVGSSVSHDKFLSLEWDQLLKLGKGPQILLGTNPPWWLAVEIMVTELRRIDGDEDLLKVKWLMQNRNTAVLESKVVWGKELAAGSNKNNGKVDTRFSAPFE